MASGVDTSQDARIPLVLGKATRWLMASCAALLLAASAVTALTEAGRTDIWIPLIAVIAAGALVALAAGMLCLWSQLRLRSQPSAAPAIRDGLAASLRTVRWVLVATVLLADAAVLVWVRPFPQVLLGVVFGTGVVAQLWPVLAHCYRLIKS
jgi:hypothetical protein